jgi:hypothetical protein
MQIPAPETWENMEIAMESLFAEKSISIDDLNVNPVVIVRCRLALASCRTASSNVARQAWQFAMSSGTRNSRQ